MRPKNGETVYNLIHSQEMVQYMWRYTLHMQATQIPMSIAFDEELDFGILARAVNEEIARNDCLRLRFFRDGIRIRQFFLKEYRLEKIRLKDFSSKDEQEAYFDKDASTELKVFAGETFRVAFFRSFDGKCGIFLNASHIIMDFGAAFIFMKDLMAVYDSLKNKTPMPKPMGSYEDAVRKEQNNPELEERLRQHAQILEDWVSKDGPPWFHMMNGRKVLDSQRRLLHMKNLRLPFVFMPVKDKTNLIKGYLTEEQSRAVDAFLEENQFSAERLIQLAIRIRLAKINDQPDDMLFWVLCPRRKTVKEKHMGGTMASPVPWRERLPEDITFRQALEQMGVTQSFLFRHSDAPYTSIRESELRSFHLTLLQSANSVMFSFLPIDEKTFGGRTYAFSGYNFGHYVIPVYSITLRDPASKRYVFTYIHRVCYTTDEDVRDFHEGVVRTLMAGIAAPDKPLKEITEEP